MNGHRHVVAYAHHGAEGVGAQTQVSILAHILERLSLLLHGVVAAAKAVDLERVTLNLACLSLALALNEFTCGTDARACSYLLQHVGIKLCRVDNNLDVVYGGTVVEGDEVDSL